jgi:hypothetical protein
VVFCIPMVCYLFARRTYIALSINPPSGHPVYGFGAAVQAKASLGDSNDAASPGRYCWNPKLKSQSLNSVNIPKDYQYFKEGYAGLADLILLAERPNLICYSTAFQ